MNYSTFPNTFSGHRWKDKCSVVELLHLCLVQFSSRVTLGKLLVHEIISVMEIIHDLWIFLFLTDCFGQGFENENGLSMSSLCSFHIYGGLTNLSIFICLMTSIAWRLAIWSLINTFMTQNMKLRSLGSERITLPGCYKLH